VFSHGFLGCATQSTFLMEAMARAGYFVLAPNHRDALCGAHHTGFPSLEASFLKENRWSDSTYKDRADDMRAVMDAALAGASFEGVPVDRKRVALAGHSLGGYTVLGLAGAWPSWTAERVKAVLAFSPYCIPYVVKGDLGHLRAPVMYQGGTRDAGITPTVSRPNGAYDSTAAPKYFVEFYEAGHFAWIDFMGRYHRIISEYSVAFLDRYLKSAPDHLNTLVSKPLPALVNDLRYDPKSARP